MSIAGNLCGKVAEFISDAKWQECKVFLDEIGKPRHKKYKNYDPKPKIKASNNKHQNLRCWNEKHKQKADKNSRQKPRYSFCENSRIASLNIFRPFPGYPSTHDIATNTGRDEIIEKVANIVELCIQQIGQVNIHSPEENDTSECANENRQHENYGNQDKIPNIEAFPYHLDLLDIGSLVQIDYQAHSHKYLGCGNQDFASFFIHRLDWDNHIL